MQANQQSTINVTLLLDLIIIKKRKLCPIENFTSFFLICQVDFIFIANLKQPPMAKMLHIIE